MKPLIIIILVVLSSCGDSRTEASDVLAVDMPMQDHPIYTLPGYFKNSEHLYRDYPWEWSILSDRNNYYLGEMIDVKILFKNKTDKTIVFSEPYNGSCVNTVGIWFSKWNPDDKKWSPIELSTKISLPRIYRSMPIYVSQGRPISINPGTTGEFSIVLNVDQDTDGGGIQSVYKNWNTIITSTPGKYRFYVQYCNLEDMYPWEKRRKLSGEMGMKAQSSEDTVIMPFRLWVLGCIEVNIHPLRDTELSKKIQDQLERWWKIRKNNISGTDAFWIYMFDSELLESLLANDEQYLNSLINNLRLTKICNSLKRGNVNVDIIIEELNKLKKDSSNKRLSEEIDVMTCRALIISGEFSAAMSKAWEITSPDGIALVELIKDLIISSP